MINSRDLKNAAPCDAERLFSKPAQKQEVVLWDWWKVLRWELMTGFILGCILVAIGMARVFIWQFLHLAGPAGYGSNYPMLAVTIGPAFFAWCFGASGVGDAANVFTADPAVPGGVFRAV